MSNNSFSHRKRVRKDVDTPDSDSECETRKLTGSWPVWLIIDAADEERPLSKLSPFAVARGIKGLSGEPKSIKKLRNGSLLVECASQKHSDMLLKSETLVNIPIKVSKHKSLNYTKGVIRCRDLRGVSEEEIKTELASQGVIHVHRVTVRKDETRVPTDTLFLTFCLQSLPESIKVGYLRVKVSLYVPSPLRCFKCQKFGHVRDRCKEEEVCGVCSKAVHEGRCSSPPLCVNCKGAHPSSAKTCPVLQTEKNIQKIKTERKISFFEARKLDQGSQPQQGVSYSDVVKSQVQMVSSASQTDEFVFTAKLPTSQAKTVALGEGTNSVHSRPTRRPLVAAARAGTASGGGSVSAFSPLANRTTPSGGGSDERPSSRPVPPGRDRPPLPPKPRGDGKSPSLRVQEDAVSEGTVDLLTVSSEHRKKNQKSHNSGRLRKEEKDPIRVSNNFAALLQEMDADDES